jgi:hypothetical protein
MTSTRARLISACFAAAALYTGLSTAPAHAAASGNEISVTASTGTGTRSYVVHNDGDQVTPAGTRFTFHSQGLISVGVFGDPQIGQDWKIEALGSGYDLNLYLKSPLLPGQSAEFALARVELSAFTQSTFALTDPGLDRIDTNYQNNQASIRCLAVVVGLPFCSSA